MVEVSKTLPFCERPTMSMYVHMRHFIYEEKFWSVIYDFNVVGYDKIVWFRYVNAGILGVDLTKYLCMQILKYSECVIHTAHGLQ